jgi:hypothetical protein
LKLLLSHLELQLAVCDADSLSMALWALAVLQQQLPSKAWARAWCEAAEATGRSWGAPALAHGVSAMAALQIHPPASLMQVIIGDGCGLRGHCFAAAAAAVVLLWPQDSCL